MKVPRWVMTPFIVLAILAVLPLFTTDYMTTVLFQMLLWAYLSSSWNVLGGFAGQLSLGHAAFIGVGAFTSTILLVSYGVTPWLGIFVGGGFAALLGMVVGTISMRLGTVYFALATLSITEMMKLLFLYAENVTGGPYGIVITGGDSSVMMFSSPVHYYLLTLVLLAIVLGFGYGLKTWKFGLNLQSIRDDEEAARSLGISPIKYKVAAAAISAFMSAIGGSVMAQWLRYVRPDIVFTADFSILAAVIAIIGGTRHPLGPLLGSALVVPSSIIFNSLLGGRLIGLNVMIYGGLLIVSSLFMREGIYHWIRERLVR